MRGYESREKDFRSRHALNFRNGEVVAKFCEMSQTSSIVLESIRKHTACHNEVPADDYFSREMGKFTVHM